MHLVQVLKIYADIFIFVFFPIHYFLSSSFETLYPNLWDKELKLFQVVPEVQMIKTLCLNNPTVFASKLSS